MRLKLLALAPILWGITLSSAHADWTQSGGNAAHSRYVPASLTQSFEQAWSVLQSDYRGPQRMGRSVAVSQGMVMSLYEGIFDGQWVLRGLDSKTGAVKWAENLEGFAGIHTYQPVMGGGNVYAVTSDYQSVNIVARDIQSGQQKFAKSILWSSGYELQIQAAYANGSLYFDDHFLSNNLYKVDGATGDHRYIGYLGGGNEFSPAVSEDGHVVALHGNTLRVFDGSGEPPQEISAPVSEFGPLGQGSPTLAGHFAIVADLYSQRVVNFDLAAGTAVWDLQGAQSNVAVDGNEVFLILDGQLASLDLLTGGVNWTLASGMTPFDSELLVTDNTVFVTSSRTTFVIDRGTRSIIASLAGSGELAYADDTLYISDTQRLYAYHARSVPEASVSWMFVLGLALMGGMFMMRRADGRQRCQPHLT